MFSPKVKIYTVHVDAEKQGAMAQPVFIREGFNLWAFIFGPLWAIYHRLWLVTLMLFVVSALFAVASKQQLLDELSLAVLQLAFSIIIGYHANDFRRAKLARRGYVMPDVVVSDSLLRAQQRFFERAVAA